jgi:hypothetical protein
LEAFRRKILTLIEIEGAKAASEELELEIELEKEVVLV